MPTRLCSAKISIQILKLPLPLGQTRDVSVHSWLSSNRVTKSSCSSRSLTSNKSVDDGLCRDALTDIGLWRQHRYISNIEMAGGIIKYVPLQPPKDGATKTSSAADWMLDVDLLEKAFSPKTQMIVRPLPMYCSLPLC